MVLKFLVRMGVMVRSRAIMYKVVVNMVLLYRSEIWVVTDAIIKVLEGFHHRIYWRIVGMMDWRVGDEGCKWNRYEEFLKAASL